MNEQGDGPNIRDRMNTADYNNFLIYSNALIHSYEEGKRIQSKLYDQRGRSLVDFKRATKFSEMVKRYGVAYFEMDEKLRRAIEYFGLQEFFGEKPGFSSIDHGKTEIVVHDQTSDASLEKSPGVLQKVKKLFRK